MVTLSLAQKILATTALFFLTSCPKDVCEEVGGSATMPGLISMLPYQESYIQNESVTLKLSIANVNTLFGDTVNLLEETGSTSPKVTLAFDQIFVENELEFIFGSPTNISNVMKMEYVPVSNSYELEIKIKLVRTGEYHFFSVEDHIQFGDRCDYNLFTNIANGEDFEIQFTVI